MKRTLAVILLAAALPAAAQFRSTSVSLGESDRVQQMRGHVSLLSSEILQGRKAGSEGEAEAAQYLHEKLEEAGVDMLSPRKGELFGIRKDSGDTLTSRNVYGFIQGYDPALRDRYIVIGARLDNLGTDTHMVDGLLKERVYRGANGNASGLAMLTELARMVSQNSILFRRSV
ncbi:MAG: M28 family peptidase, partial [Bacteroidales bacterium]|nr:M28 family peptidase [Bacteroidales bacterium]